MCRVMRKKLTTKTIDALLPAKGKRYEVRDTLVPGLHIRVSATGAKVWYLATRVSIRRTTGHASDAMLARYVRVGDMFIDNAAGAVLECKRCSQATALSSGLAT